jgi:vacuolar iron transporter family protein
MDITGNSAFTARRIPVKDSPRAVAVCPHRVPENRHPSSQESGALGIPSVDRGILVAAPTAVGRPSIHVEPHGVVAVARHYIRDLVYGANDGIITTFAVVAGVTGGALSTAVILVVGSANLAADGLSMAVGNFLSIRAHESARAAEDLPEEEAHAWKHALATFVSFVVAGALPLLPFALAPGTSDLFAWSAVATMVALFAVGAIRTLVTVDRWWRAGTEMLMLGILVAAAAYGAGALIAKAVAQ